MIGRSGNLGMALESIRAARWRSLLTVLGIVIGIVSVVTTVSLGEGAKRAVLGQVEKSGRDIVTVRPGGTLATGSDLGQVLNQTYVATLGEDDYKTIQQAPGADVIVPFSYISNVVTKDKITLNDTLVVGTGEGLPQVIGQELLYGTFFKDDEPQRNAAVIGQDIAEGLFGENVPIGKFFEVRGKKFVVRGILNEFDVNPFVPNSNYNKAVFVQYDVGKELIGKGDIYQVLIKPKESTPAATTALAANVRQTLRTAHAGKQDFTVLKASDSLQNSNRLLSLMTSFVTGIAAISLIVGGIGILNIMLVSVVERTREIGIRKAIGATNHQILNQFLTEAIILSVVGGFFGVVLSLLANYLIRIFTNMTPVITLPIVLLAFGISVTVGIIFGITPALTAARKRPIDALRYE